MKGLISIVVLSALIVPAVASADPTCTSAYGTTACGYSCVAAYGDLECAATPAGVCTAAYGEVTCWDPPRRSRHHRHHRDRDEAQAECKSAYGSTVCGYACVAAYGQVQCAQRPEGVCTAAYGEITCSE